MNICFHFEVWVWPEMESQFFIKNGFSSMPSLTSRDLSSPCLVVVGWFQVPLLISESWTPVCLLIMIFLGHTSLSFAGNSYIKYRLSESSKEEDFKLGLRLRTLQSNGIIMYTRANPCIILKVIKMGYLFLQSVLILMFWLVGWGLLKSFCLLNSEDQKQTLGQREQQQDWEVCQHTFPFVYSASKLALGRQGISL